MGLGIYDGCFAGKKVLFLGVNSMRVWFLLGGQDLFLVIGFF